MNRLIISIAVCLLTTISAFAQNLSEAEVTSTMYRAFELHKAKRYAEALDAFLIVGANVDANKSEVERQVYVCSQTMACACHYSIEQYAEGYQLAKKLIAGKLANSEKKDIYHYYVLNGYMIACDFIQKDENGNAEYQRGRELLLEIAPYADEQLKGYVLPKIPLTWYFEGASNFEKQMFEEALVCFNNAFNGFQELGLTSNAISALKQVAIVNYHTYHIEEAIKKYEQALLMSQTINDSIAQMDIAQELHRLSGILGDMEGIAKYSNLMDSLIDNSTDRQIQFEYYCQKGTETQNQGKFNLAEQWYLKSKSIVENQEEQFKSANKYLVYSDLRELYIASKQYDNALRYAYLTLDESKKFCKAEDKSFRLSYIPIANIYAKKGERENCLRSLDSLFVYEPYISEPRELSQLYTVRGSCYNDLSDYQSALTDYKKADEILASKYPATEGERVRLYALLGGVEHRLNYYDESEHYYKLYADAIKEIYGEHSLNYINAQIYLANAQGFAGHIEDGFGNYTSAVATLKEVIKKRIPYMNTAKREGFWSPLSSLLTYMTPYALKAELYQTDYTKTCYDALLLSKAFLLDSERSVYNIVQQDGDKTDMQTYMNIALLNDQIKEWEKKYVQYADSILTATSEVSRLESTLMNRCKSVGDITSFMDVDYNSVKKSLGKNDVLIDFTDFVPNAGGRRYAAYIVNKKQKYPLLKPLFAESQIDSLGIVRPDMFYDKDFAAEVIKLLWNPLKEHILEGSTVYYVPSQMLFQVCLESLPLEDGTLLGDHYHFVRLSSARELVRKQNKSNAASAVLYGGLQYDLEPNVMAENAKQYDLSSLMVMRGDYIVRGDSIFRELPGSKVEVERISEILNRSKFEVTPYTGVNGTEESFLSMHGKAPRILHLATHGFYYTPSEAEEVDYLRGYSDAMSLSGLIMSGGNAAWRGEELPAGTLGGVLTANNIAHLDLSNTDMVILSACQTGQGNATAEGLYGLQRAFKKAGVGTMVMTLWSVSDKVATEFMIKFYESLVENDWDKHKAFEQTKSYIRTQHPDPYHWAAFVMLD
ncbi:MAG: CHAT domain-containing protein [Bacteroidales bacterium]|nr:CHAT domain-containing protein [Bacteroidales bacterium]MDY5443177.1 CHAT domain-containing protein [Candidatus Cryptobacteroides sp.]